MSSLSGIGGRLYRGETSIDFIGKRRRWYAFSGILIIVSAIAAHVKLMKGERSKLAELAADLL